MEPIIQKLSPENWKAFQEIRLKALRSDPLAFSSSYEEEIDRTEEFVKRKIESSWTYVAVLNNQFIGMVRVVFESGKQLKHMVSIVSLFVDPECRKKGIGLALVKKAIADIHDSSPVIKANLVVNVAQKPAIALFKKL